MRAARIFCLSLGLLAASPRVWADEADSLPKKLGTVNFVNSCAPEAQESFERGVAYLHSFTYALGEKAFREALDRDPTCGIATWGIASLLISNPFGVGPGPEDAKRAQEVIDRGRAIGTKTQRERDFIEVIAAYYEHFADRLQRDRIKSLSDAYETLAARYPDDDEAQIFDAIYLTASQSPADKTYARALKAASILEPQFVKHPDHPGVAHYLIHTYDFPPLAQKGLPAALCYADIAPDSAHALHMPSHIFTRVGEWKKSIDTNLRSVAASNSRNPGELLHDFDYMVYAQLQLARDNDAATIVKQTLDIANGTSGSTQGAVPAPLYAVAAIPARYAVERDQWAAAAALPDPPDSKFPYTEAITLFARGVGAARSGKPEAAEKDLTRLAAIVAALKTAKNDYWATEVEVQHLGVAAWIAFAQDKRYEALALMRASADMEDASEKSAVSPGRILPARELLGDMLLESGRLTEAIAAYEASLVNDPKRLRSLDGAARAALAAGNADKARDYYARVVAMADEASMRPELINARAYLATK
jgi:tetratricopeptide (TPR) repeat protein